MKRKRSKRDSASRAEPEVRIHLPPEVSQANFRIAPLAHPDPVERQPNSLAHHLTAAKRAVTQCLKASRHAAARSAYKRAQSANAILAKLDRLPVFSECV